MWAQRERQSHRGTYRRSSGIDGEPQDQHAQYAGRYHGGLADIGMASSRFGGRGHPRTARGGKSRLRASPRPKSHLRDPAAGYSATAQRSILNMPRVMET